MTDYEKFTELWKVKLLTDLKKLEDINGTVTRGEKASIERDLRMIRYGFEEGLKEGRKNEETKKE